MGERSERFLLQPPLSYYEDLISEKLQARGHLPEKVKNVTTEEAYAHSLEEMRRMKEKAAQYQDSLRKKDSQASRVEEQQPLVPAENDIGLIDLVEALMEFSSNSSKEEVKRSFGMLGAKFIRDGEHEGVMFFRYNGIMLVVSGQRKLFKVNASKK
jgi:hypothetical protein